MTAEQRASGALAMAPRALGSLAYVTTRAGADLQRRIRLRARELGTAPQPPGARAAGRTRLFVESLYAASEVHARAELAAARADGGGLVVGVERRFGPDTGVGAAFSTSLEVLDFAGGADELSARSLGGVLYVSQRLGPWYMGGSLAWSDLEIEVVRAIRAPGGLLAERARARGGGQRVGLDLEVGRVFDFDGLLVRPGIELDYRRVWVDEIRERGAPIAGLGYADQQIHHLSSGVGAEVAYPLWFPFGALTPRLRASWEHQLLDAPRQVSARLLANDSGASAPLGIRRAAPDRDHLRVEAGFAAEFGRRLRAWFSYDTRIGLEEYERHRFRIGAEVSL